ncbi:hypothetical protein [Leeuwenhoekiella sp. MAR_2009_132]|uniref:hypothetical protein n=1 Tax=Leeuwenhoekiella sp. MAR_2009_132 TaxID=1392489 RepID=UPI000565380E|nr:hypothetical protein [Leeuwenhoekiella sp. MAR_2009_132]
MSGNRKIRSSLLYQKIFSWTKLVSLAGSSQILIQVLGLLGGILIIRLLTKQEYAYYTLANTMLGTMTLLADGGVAAGVVAEGGKIWKNKVKLGVVLETGLNLRKKFAFYSLLVSIPVLLYLLINNNASWYTAILITACLIPAFLSALSDTILQVPLKLHQEVKDLQKNQIIVALVRLLLISSSMFFLPFTFIALLANGIPRIFGNRRLKKIAERHVDYEVEASEEVQKRILIMVKRILPGTIYFCLSAQIIIWILSFYGSTEEIANVGALYRIATILIVMDVIFNTLILPRFARLQADGAMLLTRSIQILALAFLTLAFIASAIYILSDYALWVLGDEYAGLNFELLLIILGMGIQNIAHLTLSLANSKGWVLNPLLSISINIIVLVLGIFIFNLKSIIGILTFNIFIAAGQFLMNSLYLFYKTKITQ